MQSLRSIVVAVGIVGIAPAAANAGTPVVTPADVLKIPPTQKGVEFETPTDPNAIAACKLETPATAGRKPSGFIVRDGQGKLLRKFLDTNNDKSLDQWSYYQDGFEVYREIATGKNQVLTECRWMNAGGTRIAKVENIGGAPRIVGWKRISAEEASKVLVQSLVQGDLGLLETVLATPEELAALGVPKNIVDKAAADAQKRVEQFKAVQLGLKGWHKGTVWSRLDGMMPHLIPKDNDTGLTDDLTLYENAVIFAGAPNGQENPANLAFLQAPEIVKIGDTWKFVELPRPVDPTKPVIAAEGGIRSAIFGALPQNAGGEDPALAAALRELAKYDQQSGGAGTASKRENAEFHVGRIRLLRDVVKAAKSNEDRLIYNKQIVDSLAAAYQTGLYAHGKELIDQLIQDGGKIGSYAAFRKIGAELVIRNEEGGDLMANQKKWLADLKKFVETYATAEELPEALLQLAGGNEFNAEEDEARRYYDQLARAVPDADLGRKAAGALKRLDLVGKPFAIKGVSLKNEAIDSGRYQGKPVLVVFWASWADPVKRDLPELIKIYQKYHGQGFEIIGVNLDSEAKDLEQFLQENSLPWAQIYAAGGLEKNPYANEFGIISLPTMFLVDSQGKVVSRNLRMAEVEKQLEKLVGKVGEKNGVALDVK